MAAEAREVSVLFRPGGQPQPTGDLGEVLARHLVGYELVRGQRIALPGWPVLTVENAVPPGGRVGPDTELEVTAPPRPGRGPAALAILVDASLTMGEGPQPTPYDRAATLVDGFLMNGRSFLGSAGIVVQGGETRHVTDLASPETLSGALIHRVQPRGTFDLAQGLEQALALVEGAEGPRAILLVTDGDHAPSDPLGAVVDLVRAGVSLFAVAPEPAVRLAEACRHTGGRAGPDPEPVFEALAGHAGARADWVSPSGPEPVEDPEFEAVIETMEETR